MSEEKPYREIPLTKGQVAIVDAEDYLRLSRHTWYARRRADGLTFYAGRSVRVDGIRKSIHLHREITGASEGQDVDHINGNGLDNRKVNLRVCSHKQHSGSLRKQRNCSSKFKGIYKRPNGKFSARLTRDGKRISLGTFQTEIEAARAYDFAAVKYFGEFAMLNFKYGWIGEKVPDLRSGVVQGRLEFPKGEKSYLAKLTADQVRFIRSTKGRVKELAKLYGVTTDTIYNIRNYHSWKSISLT